VPDAAWGEAPVAVIVASDGKLVTADEIIEFCSGKLARYKIPRRIYFVDEFPLSASGKVVKQLLKEEIQSAKHAT
jgi:fatty-acyl-CoA synthase